MQTAPHRAPAGAAPLTGIPLGEHLAVGRSEVREMAILDAAVDVLTEVGFERLTMDCVAERAHASKATIYRHFSGKPALVAEAVRRRYGSPEWVVPDTGTLRGDLVALMTDACQYMRGDQGRLVVGLVHALHDDPNLAAIVRQQLLEENARVTKATVAQAVARGELPDGIDLAVLEEVGPAVLLHRLLWDRPLNRSFVVHLVDDVLLPLLMAAANR